MTGSWRFIITGCGTSHGNPPWGYPQHWSSDPRDRRRRSGALLLGPAGQVLLLDAGPDLRQQLCDPYADWDGLSYPERCITRCDAMLLTHVHADHCHGLNELRHLNRLMDGAGITIHGHAAHLDELRSMFPYCFAGGEGPYRHDRPQLRTAPLSDDQTIDIAGLAVTAFAMSHGPAGRVTGYRLGSMAYCTDCKILPEAAQRHLQDLDLLVLDMLREEEHPTHLDRQAALALIARLRPRHCVLVHMGFEVRHAQWRERLPEHVELAIDGWHRDLALGD